MEEEESRRKLFFFVALRVRSRALASLADVFEKNEKKNKTTSVYRLALYQTGLQCTVVINYCIFKDQT